MKTYEATEQAYKNGYAKGYEDGKRDAVKHGRKEKVEIVPNYMWKYRCGCCQSNVERRYNYCPNCGADMRGEKDA